MVALVSPSMFAMQHAADGREKLAAVLRATPANAEFDALTREHYGRLRACALRLYAGNETDANDLVHDALERALRRFDTYTPGTQAFSWFCRILHNAFIDRCRQRAAAPPTETTDDKDLASRKDDDEDDVPAWASITKEELVAAVDALDEDFRVVFRLHAFESRSYQEIATALALPLNTVGTRLTRARKKLRDALSESVAKNAGGAR